MKNLIVLILFLFLNINLSFAQELYPPLLSKENWHKEQRALRYQPKGKDFVIHNGNRRFTRALYGTHTAFRVEAGDLPEFALFMPGMGGNLKLGLLSGKQSKWLIAAASITATYRPGSMLYDIKDPMLGSGTMHLTILALSKGEGLVVKVQFENVVQDVKLFWAFGGAGGNPFSRSGDMGPDPESAFYLKPESCLDNVFKINNYHFSLTYGKGKSLLGSFPSSDLKISDASNQESPAIMYTSKAQRSPVLTGRLQVENKKDFYVLIQNPDAKGADIKTAAAVAFQEAENARKILVDRIQVDTPDPFFNTLGGTISVASDANWEAPSYLHGAIGWRMRLNGWRGPYTADPLGWHDRARQHFSSYAKSQVLEPAYGPVVADTALNLARAKEQLGTAMFSRGYISREPEGKTLRAHHYDMNLVYIDALLWHLNWTGDLAYAKEIWPVIQRHLEWEKRVYDPDGDGLYDAYAVIWASDALYYNAGAVTHSSAYNYRANAMAAKIATLLKEDPSIYQTEADRILKAINAQLWMPKKGWYAEYKDAMGLKQLHPAAALWTIYHSIDSDVPDAFQAYQSLRYVDTEIPHIPVRATGLLDKGYYTLSTTNWMPYEWSLNNVALAESTHTALANWQAGRTEEAFKLWKSEILASMYLGGSPGNFVQISHYDAIRREAYRDFGDPVGMSSRALVEGLFGIVPDALHKTLLIRPGLPAEWDHASLKIPDFSFGFKRTGNKDVYTLVSRFEQSLHLKMRVKARGNNLLSITVNGKPVKWNNVASAISSPEIEFENPAAKNYTIAMVWSGQKMTNPIIKTSYKPGDQLNISFPNAVITKIFDPQEILDKYEFTGNRLTALVKGQAGNRTAFVQLKNGKFSYWFPLCFEVGDIVPAQKPVDLDAAEWKTQKFETQDISSFFNDKVTQLFKNKYLSPRPETTTLQIPVQGIGDWPHPKADAEINDVGLRGLAGKENQFTIPSGIPFKTPSDPDKKNILFTSRWDNFPATAEIPLTGNAKAAFLLMAGSTNPMQSRMDNGMVTVEYTDGSSEQLALRNPENWWPIEQDMYIDGGAFTTGAQRPIRIHLKTGKIITESEANNWNGKFIAGGAATAIGLKLDPNKTLRKLKLTTLCNDVIIGLMAVTLIR
ncbi:DUF4450 domain-containing protein [Pedobacter frigiditerrae]|uniref:DUF4450 domain-containing protein n=1 Tax=Pedobacter frigiditerrae TaxID=2530452 RepID=UPI00293027A4|nr:DUF4450 domain-containing protein [Pedobacter frigiditerrae]